MPITQQLGNGKTACEASLDYIASSKLAWAM